MYQDIVPCFSLALVVEAGLRHATVDFTLLDSEIYHAGILVLGAEARPHSHVSIACVRLQPSITK